MSTSVTPNQLTEAYKLGKPIGVHAIGTNLYIENISISKLIFDNKDYIIVPTGISFYYPTVYPGGMIFLNFAPRSNFDNAFNVGMLFIQAANP